MGGFTRKLDIYIPIQPPQFTKRNVVSCYFDRIWLFTITSFTNNKYALTVKKWSNSEKCFLQIHKNICQSPFLDWKKSSTKIFNSNLPPPPPLPHTHTHTHIHTQTHNINLFGKPCYLFIQVQMYMLRKGS